MTLQSEPTLVPDTVPDGSPAHRPLTERVADALRDTEFPAERWEILAGAAQTVDHLTACHLARLPDRTYADPAAVVDAALHG